MANSLDQELEGKVVVLKAKVLKPECREVKSRLFRVMGGFGAHSFTSGTALFGVFLCDGETARMHGNDVERLATAEEIGLIEV